MPLLPSRPTSSNERPDLSVAYDARLRVAPKKKAIAAAPAYKAPMAPKPEEKQAAKAPEVELAAKRPAMVRIESPRMTETSAFKVKPRDAIAPAPKAPEPVAAVKEEILEAAAPEPVVPKAPVKAALETDEQEEDDTEQYDSIASAILARRAKASGKLGAIEEIEAEEELPPLEELDEELPEEESPSDMISAIRAKLQAKRLFR